MRNHFTFSHTVYILTFPFKNCFKISRALCVLVCHKSDKAMKKIPNNIKKQTETVITITTHGAKVDVHKYEATNGQATTLTGFLATNRLDVPRERKGQRWDKWQRQRRESSHVLTWDSHPTSSTPPSPHTAGEKTHFRQLTSCLSAQAIWSKSSWCTKKSKMIYCNMEKNHSKEQQNVK